MMVRILCLLHPQEKIIWLTTTMPASGTIMTISKDKVRPSPHPDSWKLAEIFATGVIIGAYLAVTTVLFFWVIYKTEFFVVS